MSLLPENKETNRSSIDKLDVWFYGEPQAGKTHAAASFPSPLILSTDGNFKRLTCPAVHIMSAHNVMSQAGIPIIKTGWEYVKDIVNELKTTPNFGGYRTIVIDLLEDFYELCRQHWLAKLGVMHESEVGYARGYEMVRNDFFGFIKDLKALPLNMILISHIKDTSNDKTISKTRPNISQKLQNKIGGYVDLVGYVFKSTTPEGQMQYAVYIDNVEPFAANRWEVSTPNIIFANYNSIVQTLVQNEQNKG